MALEGEVTTVKTGSDAGGWRKRQKKPELTMEREAKTVFITAMYSAVLVKISFTSIEYKLTQHLSLAYQIIPSGFTSNKRFSLLGW